MAFRGKRRGREGVYVYYHDKNTGKQKQISRELTEHLDSATPEEIQKWIEDWESQHGQATDRSKRINLAPDDNLSRLWSQYQQHRKKTRKRRDATEDTESGLFNNYIVQFFVATHQKKDPKTWHDLVPEFHTYLFDQKLKDQTIRYVLWALERFGKYLVWSRYMTFPYAIQVPSRENLKITPLKTRLSPKDALNFSKKLVDVTKSKKLGGRKSQISDRDFRLSVLLGYFAGLRPSEMWALQKSDFLTGKFAEQSTKTLEGFRRYGLGTKLSITVTKTWQKSKDGALTIKDLTKSHYSRAVVNVWEREAAKLIAEFLKTMPDGRIFRFTYHGMFQMWRREVLPILKVSAHDLRRASGLYLGRTKRLDLTLLQEHLRHAEIETTMLYTREPEIPEVSKKDLKQNFDEVV